MFWNELDDKVNIMQKEKQIAIGLAKASIIILSLLAIAAICAPSMNGVTPGAEKGEIEASDPATSILYDKMFYEWTGVTGIYGLGSSFGSSGWARYYHQSGNIFDVDYYDEFMGDSEYTVNNSTRARSDGMHDIFWIFNNVTANDMVLLRNPLAYADQTFTVASEARTRPSAAPYTRAPVPKTYCRIIRSRGDHEIIT